MEHLLAQSSSYLYLIIRLVMAMIMGAIIGYERATKKNTAGLRTFSIVCLASAFTMIINEYLIDRYGAGDAARLAAQVISGIGFLGMGSIILTSRNQIRGLTTAATLWATAILGLAIGAGMLVQSVIVFLLMMFIISVLSFLSRHQENYNRMITIYLEIDKSVGLPKVTEEMANMGYAALQLEKHKTSPEGNLVIQLELDLKEKILHTDVISKLTHIDGVQYIEEVKKLSF